MTPTTTPQLLEQASDALFGSWAPHAMADLLGVNESNVRRWRAGKFEPRQGVWIDLAVALATAAERQHGTLRALSAAARARAAG